MNPAIYIAEVEISASVADKINSKHSVTPEEVRSHNFTNPAACLLGLRCQSGRQTCGCSRGVRWQNPKGATLSDRCE